MKLINLLLTLLFASFALAQYNDPDGWIWIILYLFVAVTSFFAFRGDYNRGILVVAMLFVIGWMVLLSPGFIDWCKSGMPSITSEMKTTEPHIEIVREFLGLLISLIVLVFHYFQSRKFD